MEKIKKERDRCKKDAKEFAYDIKKLKKTVDDLTTKFEAEKKARKKEATEKT